MRTGCNRSQRFNPRLPCGRRLGVDVARFGSDEFQSAPPVREAITESKAGKPTVWLFQSAPPVREAIYALTNSRSRCGCFNPRLPCGRRSESKSGKPTIWLFQSAPPVREAI